MPDIDQRGEISQVIGGHVPPDAAKGAARFAGRQWVIDQVAAWAADSTPQSLLIVAEPGWGKSALAAWLVGADSNASQPGPPAARRSPVSWDAWHFCVSRDARTIDPQQLCASLAIQLRNRFPEYNRAILKMSAPEVSVTITAQTISGTATGIESITVNSRNPLEVYNQVVLGPLEAVARGDPRPILILIDGLDDALEYGAHNIVELVAASGSLPDSVRFLLTTRPERRVSDEFRIAIEESRCRVLNVSRPGDADTVALNDADVRDYVAARLRDGDIRLEPGFGADAVEAALVDAANGNFLVARFLMDQVARTGTLPEGVPKGLYPVYDTYLRRVMPETTQAGVSERWRADYQPLLGALAVARPAAPKALIPKWLARNEDLVNPVLVAVGQLVEQLDQDGDSRRLYHRSLAEYLALADIPGALGDPEPNRYFIDPREQHRRIVEYYLATLAQQWGGAWSNADTYGLRQLIPHMFALHRLTADPVERSRLAAQLCGIALDDAFQDAQREKTGDATATIEACRLAIAASLESEPVEATRDRVNHLSRSWEPHIRTLAARVLTQLSESDRAAVLADLRALVT